MKKKVFEDLPEAADELSGPRQPDGTFDRIGPEPETLLEGDRSQEEWLFHDEEQCDHIENLERNFGQLHGDYDQQTKELAEAKQKVRGLQAAVRVLVETNHNLLARLVRQELNNG